MLLCRARPGRSRVRGLLVAIGVGFLAVALAATGFALTGPAARPALDALGYPVLWLIAYAGLAYSYVFGLFNLGESARRVRLLIELHAAGPRGLTLPELLAAYNARAVVAARLRRLAAGGQIVERDGRYVLHGRATLRTARILRGLKRIFLGAPSEFDVERPGEREGFGGGAGRRRPTPRSPGR